MSECTFLVDFMEFLLNFFFGKPLDSWNIKAPLGMIGQYRFFQQMWQNQQLDL